MTTHHPATQPGTPSSRRHFLGISHRLLVAAGGATSLVLLGCQSPSPRPAPQTTGRLNAAQLAVLRGAGFREVDDGWELGLNMKILFDVNDARVKASAREAISQLGRQLRAVNIQTLRVDGHTDNLGTRAHNEQLALRRAEAVGEALALAGYSATQLQFRGLGAQFPLADNQTAEGRAENRRVAIVVPAQP